MKYSPAPGSQAASTPPATPAAAAAAAITRQLRHGQRLLVAALLLLAVAGILGGVSLQRAAALDDQFGHIEQTVLPAVRSAYRVALLVDEARGMEALLLLLDNDLERRDVERRLLRQRQQIDSRLRALLVRVPDGEERQLLAAVNTALDRWWVVQDQVLAASRQAPHDAEQGRIARLLMTGDSQAAYRQLITSLEAWWHWHDLRSQLPPRKAGMGLGLSLMQWLGLVLGVGLTLGGALSLRAARRELGRAMAAPVPSRSAHPAAWSRAAAAAAVQRGPVRPAAGVATVDGKKDAHGELMGQ